MNLSSTVVMIADLGLRLKDFFMLNLHEHDICNDHTFKI